MRDQGRTHVLFEIALDEAAWPASGVGDRGSTQSLAALARGHPSFLLAQRTVHSCAGKLEVESGEGQGTTLRISLPRDATRTNAIPEG